MQEQSLEQESAKPKSQQGMTIEELSETAFGTPKEAMIDPIEVAKEQNQDWHEITDYVTMNFRGKRRSFNDIVVYVRKECNIAAYSDIFEVRNKEEKIGNLISDIYIQKAKAQYAFGKLESQRVSRLGSFIGEKDRRSTTAIEARAAANDDNYQAILNLVSDCKSTLDFWLDMYNICLRSSDRLKQISMALMAEMKLDQTDSGGRGSRVRGNG